MRRSNFLIRTASALALVGATLGLTAMAPPSAKADTEIRFSWWGGQLRNQKTDEILKLYEKENPGVHVIREQSDWQPHWDKLKIQAAAGNQPCTIQMQTRWLSTYADPKILRPLDDLVASGKLDISGISKATIELEPRRRRQSLHDPVGRVLFRPDVQQIHARRRRRRRSARGLDVEPASPTGCAPSRRGCPRA